DGGIGEGLGAGPHPVAVELHPGELSDAAAGGDDDVLRLEGRRVFPLDDDFSGTVKAAGAEEAGDARPFQERFGSAGESLDRLVLAGEHGGQVEFDLLHLDPVVVESVLKLMVKMARFEHQLAGDASDSQAGAADRRLFLDTGGLQSQLGGPDGGDI